MFSWPTGLNASWRQRRLTCPCSAYSTLEPAQMFRKGPEVAGTGDEIRPVPIRPLMTFDLSLFGPIRLLEPAQMFRKCQVN